jgi:hypothetical protein
MRDATPRLRGLPMFGRDWRKRWLQLRAGVRLHRVASITWADDDEIWGHGATACGEFAEMHMPGLFSRMSAPRCLLCCHAAGVPPGDGAPFNQGIDA